MNAEQLTTIITNLLTSGGVVFFLGMWIRSLRKQLDVQKDTLEAVKTQVSETEKIGNIYRKLFEELPTEVEKWKVAILKLKDERIAELEKANQNKDDKQTNTVRIEYEMMINALNALEQKVSTANQLAAYSEPALSDWEEKGKSLESMMKNDHDVSSVMSGYTQGDMKTALNIWSLLYSESEPMTVKTIASKLFLDQHTVRPILEQLAEGGCVEMFDDTYGRATCRAILPKQQR